MGNIDREGGFIWIFVLVVEVTIIKLLSTSELDFGLFSPIPRFPSYLNSYWGGFSSREVKMGPKPYAGPATVTANISGLRYMYTK